MPEEGNQEINYKGKYKKLRKKYFLSCLIFVVIIVAGISAINLRPSSRFLHPVESFKINAGNNVTLTNLDGLVVQAKSLEIGRNYPLVIGDPSKLLVKRVEDGVNIVNTGTEDMFVSFYTEKFYGWFGSNHCKLWFHYTNVDTGSQYWSCLQPHLREKTYHKACIDECVKRFDIEPQQDSCVLSCIKAMEYLIKGE